MCTQLDTPGCASSRMPVLKNIFGVGEWNYSSSDWATSNWLTVSAGETGNVLLLALAGCLQRLTLPTGSQILAEKATGGGEMEAGIQRAGDSEKISDQL